MTYVLFLWALVVALTGLAHRRDLAALWREPVLRRPVLIVESDDWGAGPEAQVGALQELHAILVKYADTDGRHPVVTLGLVLANADGAGIRQRRRYISVDLTDNRFSELREVIGAGARDKVFALQLHGKEHFWPSTLMAAANQDRMVAAWLARAPEAETEQLPAGLQSRWIDGSVLPSQPLAAESVVESAVEEVVIFASIFGFVPRVAVPPTFIWPELVETAWYKAGVRFVVTPGNRYESRDNRGRPVPVGPPIRNGDLSRSGVRYMVRDDYFEPKRRHRASSALAAFEEKTRLCRPCLLEMHRDNFLTQNQARVSLAELEAVLAGVLRDFTNIAFISTEVLAKAIDSCDPEWIDGRLSARIQVYFARLQAVARFRKVLWLTLAIIPLSMLAVVMKRIRGRCAPRGSLRSPTSPGTGEIAPNRRND